MAQVPYEGHARRKMHVKVSLETIHKHSQFSTVAHEVDLETTHNNLKHSIWISK